MPNQSREAESLSLGLVAPTFAFCLTCLIFVINRAAIVVNNVLVEMTKMFVCSYSSWVMTQGPDQKVKGCSPEIRSTFG